MRAVGQQFFEDLQRDEAVRLLEPENLQRSAFSFFSLWEDYPAQVHQILIDLADGRFVLKVNESEAEDISRLRNLRSRAVIMAILSVAFAVLVAVQDRTAGERWLTWLLVGGLAATLVFTYFDLRRLK